MARSSGKDFMEFVKLRLIPAKRPDMPWTDEEVVLFQKINRGFTKGFWKRLQMLDDMLAGDDINEQGLEEYRQMALLLENANVERLRAILKLAELRGLDYEQIKLDLNLKDATHK